MGTVKTVKEAKDLGNELGKTASKWIEKASNALRNFIKPVEELAEKGVLAAYGDFYATRPMRALGLDLEHGAVRLSFVHYTEQEEVDRLIRMLESISL